MKIFSSHRDCGVTRSSFGWNLWALCGVITVTALANTAHAQGQLKSAVQDGLFSHDGQAYKVVDAASYLSPGDNAGTIAQVAYGNCNSCGTSCGGACGHSRGLGLLSCQGCNLSGDGCNNCMADPCAPCRPYWYAGVELLYMDLDGGDNRSLGDFYKKGFCREYAGRFTFGCVQDCLRGCEISFTGPFQWDTYASVTDPSFGIESLIDPVLPLLPGDFSAFSDADFQSETYQAEYWSGELNRTFVSGDMAKLLFGFRYIDYSEDFQFFSQNASGTGLVQSQVDNQMYGLQLGLDLLYPICRRGYTDFRGRLAGFVDSVDSRFSADNLGSSVVLNLDDSTELAGLIELGGGFRYRLGNWTLRAGGEFWYFANVATAPGNFNRQVSQSSGNLTDGGTNFYMLGLSLGAQLQY